MGKRSAQEIERLIAQCRKTAGDSHQAKDRRDAAAARLDRYLQEQAGTLHQEKAVSAEISELLMEAHSGDDLEFVMRRESVECAIANAEHFDQVGNLGLAGYWRMRAEKAKTRLKKYVDATRGLIH